MTSKKNAAQVAVLAEPCQKLDHTDCSAVFGVKWPEDVIAPTRIAADALDWMEKIFLTIAEDDGSTVRIRTLARMGAYLAADMANLADCSHGEMLQAIKEGGAA